MRVSCQKCGNIYDDEFRWTICPHNRLESDPDQDRRVGSSTGYCERHDLYNCPLDHTAVRT